MLRKILLPLSVLMPTQVFAFNFGFVRGPDWMDQYLILLIGITIVSLFFTLIFKPRGIPINQMYMHFWKFSVVGRIVYAIYGLSVVILMGMVFLGMGLQRLAEAGL